MDSLNEMLAPQSTQVTDAIESRMGNFQGTFDNDVEKEATGSLRDQIKDIAAGNQPAKKVKQNFTNAGSVNHDRASKLEAHTGIPAADITFDESGKPLFKVSTPDGDMHVPASELAKSFQINGHVALKDVAFRQEKEEYNQQLRVAEQHMYQQVMASHQLINIQRQTLSQEFQSVDWDNLDPFQAQQAQKYFTDKMNQLNYQEDALKRHAGEMIGRHESAAATNEQTRLKGELVHILADNPTWNDSKVMNAELGQLSTFLGSQYGFTQQEIADNIDHRLLRLMQDAHAFHTGKTYAGKRVNNARFLNTGGERPISQETAKTKAQRKALKRSGSVDSAAALLAGRM